MSGRERLESWKEISDYLKRSIKTSQRWEREFGLPIHRLEGTPKSRVFAVAEELDSWIRDKLNLAEAAESVRSLAVLPLRNLSGEPGNDYLAEGMTEMLISELGRVKEFRVISHQSTRQFRDTDRPLPEIAGILQVDALLEGAVFQDGGQIRVTANLVKAAPERHLWAHEYRCERGGLSRIQREVAIAVARHAGIELSPLEESCLFEPPHIVPEAYDLYLRGKASIRRSFVQVDIERALRYYEKAVEADPRFAAAWAELAWCHGQLGFHSFADPQESFRKQKDAAGKALSLDSTLAEAHVSAGFNAFASDWDWPQAERLLKRARELNPNSFWANAYSVWLMTCMGRHEEAEDNRKRLLALDPLNPENHWTLGWGRFWESRYDDALATFNRLLEEAPDDHWVRMARALTYSFKGLHQLAAADCDFARAGVPVGLDFLFDTFIAVSYARAGLRDKAQATLDRWHEIALVEQIDPLQYATVHLGLGDKENGLDYLERGFRERRPMMVYTKVAPFYESIRGEPRFRELLRKMKFPGS
jgi:TolB-like protein